MATAGYSFAMSKAEILAEIPKLTKEERHEIIKSKDEREIKNAIAYILSR